MSFDDDVNESKPKQKLKWSRVLGKIDVRKLSVCAFHVLSSSTLKQLAFAEWDGKKKLIKIKEYFYGFFKLFIFTTHSGLLCVKINQTKPDRRSRKIESLKNYPLVNVNV